MDFLVNHDENESLSLIRYIADEAKGETTVVYIFPVNLQQQVSLHTIRSVLMELEERGYIEILLTPNYDLSDKQRQKREDEEDYYFIEVKPAFYEYAKAREITADSYSPLVSAANGQKASKGIESELSFVSITIPVVTIGGTAYKLPTMREGLPYNIISYCLQYRPSQTITITDLMAEMKAKGISTSGMSNLRELLRKSLFGDNMPLCAFVVVSPKAILVKPQATLTKQQFHAIEAIGSIL